MPLKLPENASAVFDQGGQYNVDNSTILTYGLQGVTSAKLKEACEEATESYAKKVLGWPSGRIAKPDLFEAATKSSFNDIGQCVEHFVEHLQKLYESTTDKLLSTFPHAFAVFSKDHPSDATLVVAYEDNGWSLGQCLIAVDTQLGQTVDSLRMGDLSGEDILEQHPSPTDKEPKQQVDKYAFAFFSTGAEAALPIPALIDPATDRVQPSEATLDLISDPKNSQFLMSRGRMLELFPLICRDDEKRGWRTKGMKLHKKVFICCDNDAPKEKGVLIVRMHWDGDTAREDAALKKIGSEAEVQETRVSVKEALAKAREIAGQT